MSAEQLEEVARRFKRVYHMHGHIFPEKPEDQLWLAVQAAFSSWHSEPAELYRRVNHSQDLAGVGVTVQVRMHEYSNQRQFIMCDSDCALIYRFVMKRCM